MDLSEDSRRMRLRRDAIARARARVSPHHIGNKLWGHVRTGVRERGRGGIGYALASRNTKWGKYRFSPHALSADSVTMITPRCRCNRTRCSRSRGSKRFLLCDPVALSTREAKCGRREGKRKERNPTLSFESDDNNNNKEINCDDSWSRGAAKQKDALSSRWYISFFHKKKSQRNKSSLFFFSLFLSLSPCFSWLGFKYGTMNSGVKKRREDERKALSRTITVIWRWTSRKSTFTKQKKKSLSFDAWFLSLITDFTWITHPKYLSCFW